MKFLEWKERSKRTFEDQLLFKYWREVKGTIFTEVIVGQGGSRTWPPGSKPRRIDAVRILSSKTRGLPIGIFSFGGISTSDGIRAAINRGTVEVIEIKDSLCRPVLGQVIIGADLLKLEYSPAKIRQVVLCAEGDPVLEFVCRRRKIKVWLV